MIKFWFLYILRFVVFTISLQVKKLIMDNNSVNNADSNLSFITGKRTLNSIEKKKAISCLKGITKLKKNYSSKLPELLTILFFTKFSQTFNILKQNYLETTKINTLTHSIEKV